MSTTEAAWRSLGDLLVTRRVQLDPRWANRRTFAAETHSGKQASWYRIITSIENGDRTNYSRETLAAVEVAYRLMPGSIQRTIDSGALEPAPALAAAGTPGDPPRRAVDELRAYAEARGEKVIDVLIDEGLVEPEELVVPDSLGPDRHIVEIEDLDIPQDMKDRMIRMYLENRAWRFEQVRLERKGLDGK